MSAHVSKETSRYDVGSFISSLSRTLSAANDFLIEHLKSEGLTNLVPSHGDILACLFETEPISMQQLAERINRDPSTVTSLVKKLVTSGYAYTQKSETDHRINEVHLTEKGSELRGVFQKITHELIEVQMRGISDADFKTTCRTLLAIKNNFSDTLNK